MYKGLIVNKREAQGKIYYELSSGQVFESHKLKELILKNQIYIYNLQITKAGALVFRNPVTTSEVQKVIETLSLKLHKGFSSLKRKYPNLKYKIYDPFYEKELEWLFSMDLDMLYQGKRINILISFNGASWYIFTNNAREDFGELKNTGDIIKAIRIIISEGYGF